MAHEKAHELAHATAVHLEGTRSSGRGTGADAAPTPAADEGWSV